MDRPVRVRYAPSPTGEPHVGNIRSALFNWLYARHTEGTFIVRIEDTDQHRLVPGALEAILAGLRWLGLEWDEGPEYGGPYEPYVQSERTRRGIYAEHAQALIDRGWAYHCHCPPERLDGVRREQQAQKLPPMYDRHCRDATARERMRVAHPDAPPVVRFRIPLDEPETSFVDQVRGEVTVANATLDDFVLLKSDGFPTYHLSNVVDDHLMEITHVIRGDEWLPSTPRHVLLYRAFDWVETMPLFVHLPLILGPDRAKLSKRHGATSILDYQRQGYLPEAMVNFLALLGWSLDDKTEVMSLRQLIRNFSLERVGKTAAVFNREKLEWMNGVYIRHMAPQELARRMEPFLERDLPAEVARPIPGDYLAQVAPVVQDRLKTLGESASLTEFFFAESLTYDPALLVQMGMDRQGALAALERTLAALEPLPSFDAGALEGVLRPLAAELGVKTGQLFGALRVAVTGLTAAPPLFETMAVLGRERCLARLTRASLALKR